MAFRIAKEEAYRLVRKAISDLGYSDIEFTVEEPPREDLGDLSSNAAFILSKRLGKKPAEVAQEISNIIKKSEKDLIRSVEAHQAGYINFSLDYLKIAELILKSEFKLEFGRGKKVLVEHTSVNPNKALHIGHVRNVVLGDTLYRIFKFTGHNVYALNYIDDSGLQVADIIVGFKFLNIPLQSEKKFDHYCGDEVYVKVNELYETDPELSEKRRLVLKEMEDYNSDTAIFARSITKRVLDEQLKTCWRLKARYDCLNFESQIIATRLWDNILDRLKEKDVVKIDDSKYNGCLVVKSGIEGDEKVLVRSDGTITYIAKDIPYAAWKIGLVTDPFSYVEYAKQHDDSMLYASTLRDGMKKDFSNAELAVTVIDVRQRRLQKIIAKILDLLNSNKQYVHLSYEVVSLSSDTAKMMGIQTEKKFVHMSGRKGMYINADDVLDKLKARAYEEARQRNPEADDTFLNKVAEEVSIAAIRYSMLKQDLDKTITFDITEALNLQGDTGPYLQYAYARACRIVEKAGVTQEISINVNMRREEVLLIKEISKFDIVIEEAVKSLSPKIVARYAYTLSTLFNLFYEKVPVLQSEADLKSYRVALVKVFIAVMKKILSILGIEALERM